jgi:hypothetical protein
MSPCLGEGDEGDKVGVPIPIVVVAGALLGDKTSRCDVAHEEDRSSSYLVCCVG